VGEKYVRKRRMTEARKDERGKIFLFPFTKSKVWKRQQG
jgi:hypothetical protein